MWKRNWKQKRLKSNCFHIPGSNSGKVCPLVKSKLLFVTTSSSEERDFKTSLMSGGNTGSEQTCVVKASLMYVE